MDDSKIRQIVREELARSNGASRFAINNIPYHTHNGVDSNFIASPTIVYTGHVAYQDDFTGSGQFFLPSGWTATRALTGIYTVTHNLNTLLYGVVASATQSTNETVFPVINPLQNSFDVSWFDDTGAFKNTSFYFVLVQVNNRAKTSTYRNKTVTT